MKDVQKDSLVFFYDIKKRIIFSNESSVDAKAKNKRKHLLLCTVFSSIYLVHTLHKPQVSGSSELDRKRHEVFYQVG